MIVEINPAQLLVHGKTACPKHGKVPFQKVPFQNRGSGVRNRDLGYPESEVRIWEFRGQDSGIRNQDFENPECELQKP